MLTRLKTALNYDERDWRERVFWGSVIVAIIMLMLNFLAALVVAVVS